MPKSTTDLDYKEFFDETPVALVRTDIATGAFLMANKAAAQLLGFDSAEELVRSGRTTDFYPADDRKRLLRALRKSGVVDGYEIRMQVPNRVLWVSARLRLNCGGGCIEGSLIDITQYVDLRNKCLGEMRAVGTKLDKKIATLAG